MFTTAGATRLTIGASEGNGVSPTDAGSAAGAGTTGAASRARAKGSARCARDMRAVPMDRVRSAFILRVPTPRVHWKKGLRARFFEAWTFTVQKQSLMRFTKRQRGPDKGPATSGLARA